MLPPVLWCVYTVKPLIIIIIITQMAAESILLIARDSSNFVGYFSECSSEIIYRNHQVLFGKPSQYIATYGLS